MHHLRRPFIYSLAVLGLALSAYSAGFRKEPYLVYMGDTTTMKVVWQADGAPGSRLLEWGLDTSYSMGSSVGTLITDNLYEHEITGLTEDTKYYYRVTIDGNVQAHTFRTAPPDSKTTLTMYAFGDTRSNPGSMNAVMGDMLADANNDLAVRQTLCLLSGDWVNTGSNESDWDGQYFYNGSSSVQFRGMFPVMGPIGNHEDGTSVTRKYLRQPYASSGYNFAFSYGPVHIICMDQYIAHGSGSAQYNWVLSELQNNQDKHIIVTFHEPGYSAGTHSDSSTIRNTYQPLFEQYNVKLVINGHNHNYARSLVNGVNHIVTGGGGAPLYNTSGTFNPYIVKHKKCHNYIRIDIDSSQATVTAINTDTDSTIETFQFTGPDFGLTVANAGASDITLSSATVSGRISNTDGDDPRAWICYGTSDGGTDTTGWDHVESLGVQVEGPVSTGLTGLSEFTTYYYRFAVSNAVDGLTWASSADSFRTLSSIPVASNGTASVIANGSVDITLLATDGNGDPLTYSIVGQPGDGSVFLANNVVTYTPDPGFSGSDSFTFKASDGTNDSNVATVDVTVRDSFGIINIDINGDATSYFFTDTSVLCASGVTWNQPQPNSGGTLTFSSLLDQAGEATAVQLKVTNVTDTYDESASPTAWGRNLMRDYLYLKHSDGVDSSTITISGLDSLFGYVAGSTTFDIVLYGSNRQTSPNNDAALFTMGTLSKTVGLSDTLSPTEFTEGVDYARFTGVADSSGTIAIGWDQAGGLDYSSFNGIQIGIEAPAAGNRAPVASSGSYSVVKDGSVDITLVATDADSDPLSYSIVAPPTNGSVVVTNNVATYTPNTGYTGVDSFTFKANDGTNDSNVATVDIAVVLERVLFLETFDNAAWTDIVDPNSGQKQRFDAWNYLPGTVATNPATFHGVEISAGGANGGTGWEWMMGSAKSGIDEQADHRAYLVNDAVNGGALVDTNTGYTATMNGTSYFSFFRNTGIMLNLTDLGLVSNEVVSFSFDWVHGFDARDQYVHYAIVDGQPDSSVAFGDLDDIDLGNSYGNVFAPDEVATNGAVTVTGINVSSATGEVYLVFMNQGNIRGPTFDNIRITAMGPTGSSQPFDDWRSSNFTPQQLGDTNISGVAADPMSDGIPNLVKYVLNLDPWVFGGIGSGWQGSGSDWVIGFDRNTNASDANLYLDMTDSLATGSWQSIAFSLGGEALSATNGAVILQDVPGQTNGVQVGVPLSDQSFFRYRAVEQ